MVLFMGAIFLPPPDFLPPPVGQRRREDDCPEGRVSYSAFRLLVGLAKAARTAWKVTVNRVISNTDKADSRKGVGLNPVL